MSYETPWLIRYMNTAEILEQITLLAMQINNIYLSFCPEISEGIS